jgi:hypothetical protein
MEQAIISLHSSLHLTKYVIRKYLEFRTCNDRLIMEG